MSIVMNYEAMFGAESELITDRLMPDILPVTIRESIIKEACEQAVKQGKWLLIFVVGTKPCFYKFMGSIIAAEKQGIPFIIVNAGQHYDSILTYGAKEFGYDDRIAINLSIRGDLAQKAGEIIFKMSWLARYISKHWPKALAVPIVLGDTILTNTVPMAWMFAIQRKAIHLEAGLRSMYPVVFKSLARRVSMEKFIDGQINGTWDLLCTEPFPEQYDTFTASAGCEYLFAPLEINRGHLIREGYYEKNIFVVGGTVVDALKIKTTEKPKESVFDHYPVLKENKWIRVDVHRKENLTRRRLESIVGAIKMLVKKGYYLNFVEMNATSSALDQYGLKRELHALRKKKNFLYTPVWKEYSHVIEFYSSENCLLALTDSGGLQEELNMIGKPCLTLRFNTDRPETVREGRGNLLVPPVSAEFIAEAVIYITKNAKLLEKMSLPESLYGKNVGDRFINSLSDLMKKKRKLFLWAHERLGLWSEKE